MGEVNISVEQIIHCPLTEVADYSADPDKAPLWYDNIQSVEWLSDKPLQTGSLLKFKAVFMGRKMSYVYKITEWEKNKYLQMSSIEGPFPMNTTYSWESIDGMTTKMTLRNHGSPSGLISLFIPLMAGMMRRANRHDMEKLKGILDKK